jgi:hypothetical protein
MAIVVEQERAPRLGLVKIVLWLIIIAVIAAAVYYLFFKRPDTIPNLIAPNGFQNTSNLSKINLDPAAVIQNPVFQSLKSHVGDLPTSTPGRANPFLPF